MTWISHSDLLNNSGSRLHPPPGANQFENYASLTVRNRAGCSSETTGPGRSTRNCLLIGLILPVPTSPSVSAAPRTANCVGEAQRSALLLCNRRSLVRTSALRQFRMKEHRLQTGRRLVVRGLTWAARQVTLPEQGVVENSVTPRGATLRSHCRSRRSVGPLVADAHGGRTYSVSVVH